MVTIASQKKTGLSEPFLLRRLHSLLGLWLVLYLAEHLFVNSQAAWYFFDEGSAFIRAVNQIHHLPYLKVIEIVFLGLPFLIHGVWGIKYALTAKKNAHPTDGSNPALTQYRRNHAFSWQRITSWILLVGIVAHVVQMRFLEYPREAGNEYYSVSVTADQKLDEIVRKLNGLIESNEKGRMIVLTPTKGAAFFIIVRETFKSPWMAVLYSLFVVAAVFHACNGFWTFLIKWGMTLSMRSQQRMEGVAWILMAALLFLGLFAIWGVYIQG